MRKKVLYFLCICVCGLLTAGAASADTITFVTPSGSTTSGGSVDASATFVTANGSNGTGTVTITLTDLQANPKDVAQLISDLDFTLSNDATSGTLASISGTQIQVNGDGSTTSVSGDPTHWFLHNNVSGGLQLDALGSGHPTDLVIGPSGPGGVYTNANGSIAGNGPHNPFTDGTATFVVDVAGVTMNTNIDSAVFSFGTTAGIDVTGTPTPVIPEPPSLVLLGTGLACLAGAFKAKVLLA